MPGGLGARSWLRFDLSEGFGEGTIDLMWDNNIVLHLKVIESDRLLVINSFFGKWGIEKSINIELYYQGINILQILEEEDSYAVSINGCDGIKYVSEIKAENIVAIRNRLGFGRLISDTPAISSGWRQCAKSSGIEATSPSSRMHEELVPGITAIVRAKNEEQTVFDCLDEVASAVDSVIAVDNLSTDATYSRMRDAQRRNFNVELFGYDVTIPRVGSDHELAISENSSNTLGRYYNYCLSKCRTSNFMKWDADFLPIKVNLLEMISKYNLHSRSDNFSIWFSGISVWRDGDKYWIDEEAHYNEFRVHSFEHGAKWVDLPPWEEIDQSYLFKAQLYAFEKPVFVEVFDINPNEFLHRGYCQADKRDVRRYEALKQYSELGSLPPSFTSVDSLKSKLITNRGLSEVDKENAEYMIYKYNSVPTLSIPELREEIVKMEAMEQMTLGVFCISHRANAERRKTIRETMKKDFDLLGIPFYFVVGDLGRKPSIEKDVITLDCPDTYEFLSTKIAALACFFMNNLNFQYMFKMDDDTCVNAVSLSQLPYYKYNYYGGGFAGGRNLSVDWHRGKCYNRQLDELSIISESGRSWYGGGFGYFLSRESVAEIAKNSDEMRGRLYEDVAVGRILERGGLFPDSLPAPFDTSEYWKTVKNPSIIYQSNLIVDIPSCELIRSIYSQMKRVSVCHMAEEALDVATDWWEMPSPGNNECTGTRGVAEKSADAKSSVELDVSLISQAGKI